MLRDTFRESKSYDDSSKTCLHNRVMNLGSRIKYARERAGLSQEDVARRFKVHRAAVSQWENGKTRPASGKLAELADVLSVSAEWLLGNDYACTTGAGAVQEVDASPNYIPPPRSATSDIIAQMADMPPGVRSSIEALISAISDELSRR